MFFGMYLHPIVGSATHNLFTVGHPRALNQCTTAKQSFVSQHFSPKRMDESHPLYYPLNRQKNEDRSTYTHSMCQHETFISFF